MFTTNDALIRYLILALILLSIYSGIYNHLASFRKTGDLIFVAITSFIIFGWPFNNQVFYSLLFLEALIVFFLFTLESSVIVRVICRPLIINENPCAVDVIFVLGARMRSDGSPGQSVLARLFKALQLLGSRFSNRIHVFSSPADSLFGNFAEDVCRTFFPNVLFSADTTAKNTWQEAMKAAEFIRTNKIKTFIVVTDYLHTKRAKSTFETMGLNPIMIATPYGQFSPLDKNGGGINGFLHWLYETIATIKYYFLIKRYKKDTKAR